MQNAFLSDIHIHQYVTYNMSYRWFSPTVTQSDQIKLTQWQKSDQIGFWPFFFYSELRVNSILMYFLIPSHDVNHICSYWWPWFCFQRDRVPFKNVNELMYKGCRITAKWTNWCISDTVISQAAIYTWWVDQVKNEEILNKGRK